MFVEGPGYVAHYDALDGTQRFLVLGPFPVGTVIRRVRVAVSGAGAASVYIVAIGAVIGASNEPTAAAFAAGRTLIQRSNVDTFGKPTITLGFAATGGERRLVFPVGVTVKGGPLTILVGFVSSIANPVSGIVASASSQRPVGPGRGPQGVEESE